MARTQVALLLLVIGPLSVLCLYWDNPRGDTCASQGDCLPDQCCVNADPGARSGICENRRRVSADCHNPRPTGFHHVSCPGPAGIVHPDLCPCGCGEFCAMGFNPRQNSHGGYTGTCTFG